MPHFNHDLEQVKVRELLLAQVQGQTSHAIQIEFFDDLKTRLSRIDELEDSVDDLQTEAEDKQTAIHDLEGEKADVEKDLEKAEDQICDLETLLADAQDEHKALREKIAELLLAPGEVHTPREEKIVALILAGD